MGTLILRWFSSRTVRQAMDMCRQVRKLVNGQRDLLSPEKIQELSKAVRELKGAIAAGEKKDRIEAQMKNLEKVVNENLRAYPHAGVRENVEVFLVTGAVVLALRTFFFQPMAIPSGSAQPTLWGITYENLRGKPGVEIPHGLQKLWQTCWSGVHYYHVVAKAEGTLRRIDPPVRVLPLVKKQTIWLDETPYTIWFPPDKLEEHAGLVEGQVFHRGDDIVRLKMVSGDHLFVNTMVYNFRRPRRGEIIVFSTHDIDRYLRVYRGYPVLIPDTHYIKRLVALGGEHVSIGNDRHVRINGKRLDASTPGFENVYGFDPKEPPRADHYSGHVNGYVGAKYGQPTLAPLFPNEATEFVVRPHYLLPFGDNTMNSFDGRAWGDFPENKLVGRASFVFWPIGGHDEIASRFGWGYR